MKQINVTVSDSSYKSFKALYPHCLSRFIRNCLFLAVSDRNFFSQIFFLEVN